MLRVCGVTFDHTSNYGSWFQAYALQFVILEMEIDGERCEYELIPASTIRSGEKKAVICKGGLLARARNHVFQHISRMRKKRFSSFEKEYMRFVDCTERSKLRELNDRFDAFVCGSDVIWNFIYTNGDPLFFLDFAEKYRFSYAASFGKADLDYSGDGIILPEPANDIYRRYIPRLNRVSVREQYAKELVRRFTDKDVDVVCDPTLLMTREQWLKLADSPGQRRKYIFAYSTSTRPNFMCFLKQLQRETRLPVVQITWQVKDAFKQRSLTFPTAQQWLSLISGAEYVVTNSFHGTAFSVIFRRKFFTAIQGEWNVRSNVRLYDFLNELGLEDRLYAQTPEIIPKEMPDFSLADERLSQMREHSMKYIRENLEEALQERQTRQVAVG